MNLLNTHKVLLISVTVVLQAFRWTDTCTAGLGGDVGIDTDDVCHGEEGSQTRSYFSEEITALPFSRL